MVKVSAESLGFRLFFLQKQLGLRASGGLCGHRWALVALT